ALASHVDTPSAQAPAIAARSLARNATTAGACLSLDVGGIARDRRSENTIGPPAVNALALRCPRPRVSGQLGRGHPLLNHRLPRACVNLRHPPAHRLAGQLVQALELMPAQLPLGVERDGHFVAPAGLLSFIPRHCCFPSALA